MSVPPDLGACVADRWSPVIGDPGLLGWVTVAAHGLAVILCLAACLRPSDSIVRLFWLALAVVLLGLIINEQLDLQSAVTATGRCLSQIQGWYENRRIVQLIFIAAILMTGFNLAVFSLWVLRNHLRQIGLAVLGLIILICFVVIRAAGLHSFDLFLNTEVQSIRINWILELTSLALIAVNAIIFIRRDRM